MVADQKFSAPNESHQVEVKSIDPLINFIISVVSFSCYFFLSFYIIKGSFGWDPQITIILFLFSWLGAYFTAKILSRNNTTIKIENGNLEISETTFLNTFRSRTIDLQEIKGYELYETKYFKQLIFYKTNHPPFILTLADNYTPALKEFLNGISDPINQTNKLSNLSFQAAFIKVFLLLLFILAIQSLILVLFELHSIQKYQHPLVINLNLVWKFALINLFIFLLFKKLFNRYKLRVNGRNFSYIIIALNFFSLTVILNFAQSLWYNPRKVSRPEEIVNYRKDKIFTIDNNIHVDTSIVGYHYTIANNSRSTFTTFTYYFASPIYSFQTEWHHLWIGQTFKHKVKQRELQTFQQRPFLEDKKQEFQRSLLLKAQFYEVSYSDFNPSFNQKGFFSSAIATYKSIVPLMVLTPHFETFKEYRKSIMLRLKIFAMIILSSITIAAIVSANHR
ncbi:MAG TPA: hypothetical protein VEV16_12095 [Daejeonella sp.]|nr:hypothetical protein [Daejeonella sp.]